MKPAAKIRGFPHILQIFPEFFFRGLLLFPRQAAAKARASSMSSDISPEVPFRDPLPASGIIPVPSVSFRFRKTLFPATPAFILSISRRFRSRKRVQKYSLFPDPQTGPAKQTRGFFWGNFMDCSLINCITTGYGGKIFKRRKEEGKEGHLINYRARAKRGRNDARKRDGMTRVGRTCHLVTAPVLKAGGTEGTGL